MRAKAIFVGEFRAMSASDPNSIIPPEGIDPKALKQQAAGKKKEYKKFFKKLKSQKRNVVDAAFHEAHTEVFACTDCLQCANCCKTTGPLFTDKDIARIAKHLRLRPAEFVGKYLRVDEDGDHVLQSVPCPFLGDDNYCGMYEVRPKACREFPHTDRHNMPEIFDLTLKNASVCPAVGAVIERVHQQFKDQ